MLLRRNRSVAFKVARDGGGTAPEILAEGYGDLHSPSLSVEWGSITKTVTAFSACELDRMGIVDLSRPVVDILPSSRLSVDITMRHLVDHTSGLRRLPNGIESRHDPYKKFTTNFFDENVVPNLTDLIEGEVGENEQYSNLGYAVLGRALEVETNMTWWGIVQRFCFDPLGVKGVAINPLDSKCAHATDRRGMPRNSWTMSDGPFLAAGGLWGSISTLEKYARAVSFRADGKKISGWRISGNMWWHNGHTRDAGAFVGVDMCGKMSVVVSTLNCSMGTADRVASNLVLRYRGESRL